MTLADMMLMILEISSKSGICEELFLTVNQQVKPEVCFTPVPFGCIRFLFFFPLFCCKVFVFHFNQQWICRNVLFSQVRHKIDFVSAFEGQKHGQNMPGRRALLYKGMSLTSMTYCFKCYALNKV